MWTIEQFKKFLNVAPPRKRIRLDAADRVLEVLSARHAGTTSAPQQAKPVIPAAQRDAETA